MIMLGPYLAFENEEKYWYRVQLDESRKFQIEKSVYVTKLDDLNWIKVEYRGEFILYSYDPHEKISVAFIFNYESLKRIPLHELIDNSCVISQVEFLSINNGKISWNLENNVLARIKYPNVDKELYPRISQQNEETEEFNITAKRLRRFALATYEIGGEKPLENSTTLTLDATDMWESLLPDNCYIVTEDDVPIFPQDKNMYIWYNNEQWYYKISLLDNTISDILPSYLIHEVLNIYRRWHSNDRMTHLNKDNHLQLLRILSESYLKLSPLQQNKIISTLQPSWPLAELLEPNIHIANCFKLLELKDFFETKNDMIENSSDILDFKNYLYATIDFFAVTITREKYGNLNDDGIAVQLRSFIAQNREELRINIVNFIGYLFLSSLKKLGVTDSLPLRPLQYSLPTLRAERHVTFADDGLSARQHELFILLFSTENASFRDYSNENLQRIKYTMQGIINPQTFFDDDSLPVANDVLTTLIAQDVAENESESLVILHERCNVLINRINAELVLRVIKEFRHNRSLNIAREFMQITYNFSGIVNVFKYLTNAKIRFILNQLNPELKKMVTNGFDLAEFFKVLRENEAALLIRIFKEHITLCVYSMEHLQIILNVLPANLWFEFFNYVNLQNVIQNSEDLLIIMQIIGKEKSVTLIHLLSSNIDRYIHTLPQLKEVLRIIPKNKQKEILPIFTAQIESIIVSTEALNDLLADLSIQGKIFLLEILSHEIFDLTRDHQMLVNLLKQLPIMGIDIFIENIHKRLPELIPNIADLFTVLLSQELNFDQSEELILNIQKQQDLFNHYKNQVSNFVMNLLDLETEENNYFPMPMLTTRWSICASLFLNDNVHDDYRAFVHENSDCFLTAYTHLLRLLKDNHSREREPRGVNFFSNRRISNDELNVSNWLWGVITGEYLNSNVEITHFLLTPSDSLAYQVLQNSCVRTLLQASQAVADAQNGVEHNEHEVLPQLNANHEEVAENAQNEANENEIDDEDSSYNYSYWGV